ncbi:uncharacterized protein [Periplaneta americana]|uniref:uncharacterized protein isoform X3 n=1 Tax=Periplaneta americana TaxID=6978 RepID=UPI0037E91B00
MMDVIKTELEVDPLSLETTDDTEEEEKKPILEKWNFFDQHVTVNQSPDLTSEIKFEGDPVPFSFPVVKREQEEEQSNLHTVNEEPKVEVTTENNEVFTERLLSLQKMFKMSTSCLNTDLTSMSH